MTIVFRLLLVVGIVAGFFVYENNRHQDQLATCAGQRDMVTCLTLSGWSEHDALIASLHAGR